MRLSAYHNLAAALLMAVAEAHMSIIYPPPFNHPKNPLSTKKDYDNINSPLSAAQFPCKNIMEGTVAATLTAGAESNITFDGSANHDGGSCQVGLSYDKKKFTVIHSFIGKCPIPNTSLSFTVPADAPAGNAVFFWSWNNKLGNREFYMNCAGVEVKAGSGGATPKVAFNDRPDIFVANLDNGCTVPASTDVVYPDPGPDVTGSVAGSPITGCQPVNGIGNSAGKGSGGGNGGEIAPAPSSSAVASSIAPSSSAAPAPSTATVIPLPSTATVIPLPSKSSSSLAAPISSAAPSTGKISTDGTCGGSQGLKCATGFCCSSAGFCGDSALHCGQGCNLAFGECKGSAGSSPITTSLQKSSSSSSSTSPVSSGTLTGANPSKSLSGEKTTFIASTRAGGSLTFSSFSGTSVVSVPATTSVTLPTSIVPSNSTTIARDVTSLPPSVVTGTTTTTTTLTLSPSQPVEIVPVIYKKRANFARGVAGRVRF